MCKQVYYVIMKRLTAISLIVVGIALPVCAQRSGSRGGFSGHSGSAFHGGFGASAPSRATGSPHYAGSRSPSIARGLQRSGAGNFNARPAHGVDNRNRRPERPDHRERIPYLVSPWAGWVSPYIYGYPDDSNSGASPVTGNDASGGYDGEPLEQDQPAPGGPYLPYPDQSRQPPAAVSEEAVTIVFKDGRPAEKIQNYVLTKTTLYVMDQRRRIIPTDQLDLDATAKMNHDAGIEFQLPGTHK